MANISELCQAEAPIAQGNGGFYPRPQCPFEGVDGSCTRSELPLQNARDVMSANPVSEADAQQGAPGVEAGIRVVCNGRIWGKRYR